MSEESQPAAVVSAARQSPASAPATGLAGLAGLTDEGLEALLKRAVRLIVIVGLLATAVLWLASGWRNAAMLATGAAISAASIYEWRRLIRILNSKLDQKQAPRGVAVSLFFLVLRLTVFAGAIYGSLKGFQGSVVALLCGLGLAVVAMVWEAVRLLRD
jgi:small-conductance mechanosensitive channel